MPSCSRIPYGAVFVTVAYSLFCFLVVRYLPDCVATNSCPTSSGRLDHVPVAWAADIFIAVVSTFLAWHVLCTTERAQEGRRRCRGFVAFTCFGISFALSAVSSRFFVSNIENGEEKENNRGYYILPMISFLFATDGLIEVGALTINVCKSRLRSDYRPFYCGVFSLRLCQAIVIIAFLAIAAGSFWCTSGSGRIEDILELLEQKPTCVQMVDYGKMAWYSAAALLWMCVASLYGGLAKQLAEINDVWVYLWGLTPPLGAAGLMFIQIVMLIFLLARFAVEKTRESFDNEDGEDTLEMEYEVATAGAIASRYFMLMTIFLSHNLLASNLTLQRKRRDRTLQAPRATEDVAETMEQEEPVVLDPLPDCEAPHIDNLESRSDSGSSTGKSTWSGVTSESKSVVSQTVEAVRNSIQSLADSLSRASIDASSGSRAVSSSTTKGEMSSAETPQATEATTSNQAATDPRSDCETNQDGDIERSRGSASSADESTISGLTCESRSVVSRWKFMPRRVPSLADSLSSSEAHSSGSAAERILREISEREEWIASELSIPLEIDAPQNTIYNLGTDFMAPHPIVTQEGTASSSLQFSYPEEARHESPQSSQVGVPIFEAPAPLEGFVAWASSLLFQEVPSTEGDDENQKSSELPDETQDSPSEPEEVPQSSANSETPSDDIDGQTGSNKIASNGIGDKETASNTSQAEKSTTSGTENTKVLMDKVEALEAPAMDTKDKIIAVNTQTAMATILSDIQEMVSNQDCDPNLLWSSGQGPTTLGTVAGTAALDPPMNESTPGRTDKESTANNDVPESSNSHGQQRKDIEVPPDVTTRQFQIGCSSNQEEKKDDDQVLATLDNGGATDPPSPSTTDEEPSELNNAQEEFVGKDQPVENSTVTPVVAKKPSPTNIPREVATSHLQSFSDLQEEEEGPNSAYRARSRVVETNASLVTPRIPTESLVSPSSIVAPRCQREPVTGLQLDDESRDSEWTYTLHSSYQGTGVVGGPTSTASSSLPATDSSPTQWPLWSVPESQESPQRNETGSMLWWERIASAILDPNIDPPGPDDMESTCSIGQSKSNLSYGSLQSSLISGPETVVSGEDSDCSAESEYQDVGIKVE